MHPAKDRIEVRVSDSGRGIEPEDLERVFDRFYRGAPGDASEIGSGLGLAIVKRIVELHGSIVEANSVPGRGATFAFRLSRAA